MHEALAVFAAILLVAGLTLYAVLGGADFGTGMWDLSAGRGRRGERIRALLHSSMGPVWEANHVWLIFTLVVLWTSFPDAFAAIMSTMYIPLFLAAFGIILRGSSYAFRPLARTTWFEWPSAVAFGIASIMTPFFLGTVIGGIAGGHVPPGNAQGDAIGAWWNATGVMVGVMAVVTGAYLAAIFTMSDAHRRGEDDLRAAFRVRALVSGVLAGAVAIATLPVLHADAPELFHRLLEGPGLVGVIISFALGAVTLWLVWTSRASLARWSGAGAVAAIAIGWALAQAPYLLPPTLTVEDAAAPSATLWALVGAAVIFLAVVVPSLVFLFRLQLADKLGHDLPPMEIEVPGV
jgi:cytochrome d ubiquinol oxidase subunit II